MTTKVVFLIAHPKSYRLAFWNQLYDALAQYGVELRVVYGDPNAEHAARHDNATLPSEYGRPVGTHWFLEKFVLHTAWSEIADADLIITGNENKLLLNPILFALSAGRLKRVAFWGKGNIHPAGIWETSEWLRYKTRSAVDWWFPYTESMAANLRQHGVRCGITPVRNATDTAGLQRDLAGISQESIRTARYSIGLSSGPVGIYCGNLSPNKELDFLFSAAKLVREAVPQFSLLVIGNGPQREHVEVIATHNRAIRFLGPRNGPEKALLLRMSDVFLLPGAVGLGILDSFAAGLPFLTTEGPSHGPEISYLRDGYNGLITAHDPAAYAEAVIRVLQDSALSQRLRRGASECAQEYTIEGMVENFRRGILECLGKTQPVRRAANQAVGRVSNPAVSHTQGRPS
jgi:glycosyltransferase involved in cell wall biosynthesis